MEYPVLNLRRPIPILAAVACLGLLAGACARAQVAEDSPFLPPGAAAGPNGSADSAVLELRGIMTTPDGTRFCIYDPVKKSGTWSGLNERGNAFIIKSADLPHLSVVVQSEGHTLKLVLHQARIAALGPAGAPGAPLVTAEGAGPSPADQAQRLQAVAEEVRRRRALREQAAQQGGTDQGAPADAGSQRRSNRQQQ
jgi:hypothetical protein